MQNLCCLTVGCYVSTQKYFLWPQSKAAAATFFNKSAIQLYFPANVTGEEPQNIDTVLFFMRLHMDIS